MIMSGKDKSIENILGHDRISGRMESESMYDFEDCLIAFLLIMRKQMP